VGWEDFGGVRRTTWRVGMVRRALSFPIGIYDRQCYGGQRKDCAVYSKHYSVLVQLVKYYLV